MTKFLLTLAFTGLALAAHAQGLYEITQSTALHDRRQVSALRVRVDGSEARTRDFLQDFMKDNYNIRLKPKGLLGTGKKDELVAQQVPSIGAGGQLSMLYVNLNAPTDSTTEVALFGGPSDKSTFDFTTNASEFTSMRLMLEKLVPAARTNAYRLQVKDAEDNAAAIDKQRDKLEHSVQSAKSNTASNLKRMDELRRQNLTNAQQVTQDSTQLLSNARLAEAARLHLQRRQAQLTAAPK
ncbi:MAG: hypothetical protein ACRYFX_18480 [Janthinobacterium lividum]